MRLKKLTLKELNELPMIAILITVFLLVPSLALGFDPLNKFDEDSKVLFGSVIALQIIDGMSAIGCMDNGSHISETWAWKYPSSRPSSEELWVVKGAELILCYYVAKKITNKKYRRWFLTGVAALLTGCIMNNQSVSTSFKITY